MVPVEKPGVLSRGQWSRLRGTGWETGAFGLSQPVLKACFLVVSRLDRHLASIDRSDDSVPIEDYMIRWCNAIHQPDSNIHFPKSPTPASKEPVSPTELDSRHSADKLENLQKYNNFMNDLSIRVEGGWLPPDTLPYDEDLLYHTLGLSHHVAPPLKSSNPEFYSILE